MMKKISAAIRMVNLIILGQVLCMYLLRVILFLFTHKLQLLTSTLKILFDIMNPFVTIISYNAYQLQPQ